LVGDKEADFHATLLSTRRRVAADLELAEGLSIFCNFRSDVDRVLAPNLDVLVHQPSWGLLHAMYTSVDWS
jgi:hypothetical protein